MLLAIPFQGIAAAAMLSCAHGALQQQAATPAGHCHEAGAPAAVHEAKVTGSDTHGQQHDQHPGEHHDERCSACAACCIGAAMAGAPTLPAPPPTLSARLIDAATGRLEAVDLALPERPPRFPLA